MTKLNINDHAAHILKAHALYYAGRSEDAEVTLKRLLSSNPEVLLYCHCHFYVGLKGKAEYWIGTQRQRRKRRHPGRRRGEIVREPKLQCGQWGVELARPCSLVQSLYRGFVRLDSVHSTIVIHIFAR